MRGPSFLFRGACAVEKRVRFATRGRQAMPKMFVYVTAISPQEALDIERAVFEERLAA